MTAKGGVGAAYEGAAFQPLTMLPRFDVGVSAAQPHGLYFRPDGKRFYVVSRSLKNMHEFRMVKPWRVDTAIYVGAYTIPGFTGTSEGFTFKPDGTALYVSDLISSAAIRQYALATPWDLSTLSNPNISKIVSAQDTTPTSLVMKSDGTKLFMCGRGGNRIYEYTLSTPGLISSATYVTHISSLSPSYAVTTSPDGTRLFHDRGTNFEVVGFTLGTPWSLGGTITTDTPRMIHSGLRQLFYREDGKALYIMDSNYILQQYGGV
ncbi:YncE family protein [Shinella sp.]|uniref:YncE family protein n=1 Tax=Shinella sp. TaxID=1870904 RepID=UPI003D27AD69